MAETFNRAAVALTTTSITDVYQAPNVASTDRAVVLSCIAANVDAANNAAVTITITDSSNVVLSRIANAIVVPLNASLEVIANKLILKRGEKIRATASAANRLEVTVSVLEIAA